MKKRKIAVVTGSRAEYGLLYWLMREIQEDNDLLLQVIVTGSHLAPEFGLTYQQIESDGFQINAKVEMLLSSDSSVGIAKSIGLGVIGFADTLHSLQPDLIVVLGDRYEILAAAQAAMVARIPIAHLCGGESSLAVIDDPIRHAITKMAQLHFVTAEPYRQRVIQMGEDPNRVYNVGTPGLDHMARTKLLDKNQLEESLDFQFGQLNFLITYHNVTLVKRSPKHVMEQIFTALDAFPNAKIIFTDANADTEGRMINAVIKEYLKAHPNRGKHFQTLGYRKYLSILQYIDVVLGNSSSGLVEVPCFKKATINIGARQQGRLRASSVICCDESAHSITAAIHKALSPEFQTTLTTVVSPYGMGSGNVSFQIKEKLKSVDVESVLIKNFYEINPDQEWERC